MGLRSTQPRVLEWQRERLFVRTSFIVRTDHIAMACGCWMGAKHNTDNLRGMLAIRVGFLASTINALYELLGV